MGINIRKITVIGDGGWGTTLAIHLARQGYPVRLWSAFPKYVTQVQKRRENFKYLPGIRIPPEVRLTANMADAVKDADLIVLAVPSVYLKDVLRRLKRFSLSDKVFLSVVKGIDTVSLKRMSELIHEELGPVHLAVLSGPTIAPEVARGLTSSAVVASHNTVVRKKLQKIFNSNSFRIYTNSDIIGVEIGGSVKNIIAIACGVCQGLGLGTNAKAAIMTRGLAEMARLGKALGAKTRTFSGLSGLGDLATTCFNEKSRNHGVGEALGRGRSVKAIITAMDMVAEGIPTVKAVHRLSLKINIPMPIVSEVYKIIYANKDPRQAAADLMHRKTKTE